MSFFDLARSRLPLGFTLRVNPCGPNATVHEIARFPVSLAYVAAVARIEEADRLTKNLELDRDRLVVRSRG